MSETRSVKISAVITPALAERLDAFAEQGHWPRSTAIAVLIERGLEASEPVVKVHVAGVGWRTPKEES